MQLCNWQTGILILGDDKMIKVTFYAEDDSKNMFNCRFRSIEVAERFIDNYKYIGEFNRFSVDIWGDTDDNSLPIIPCNWNGLTKVFIKLYPYMERKLSHWRM